MNNYYVKINWNEYLYVACRVPLWVSVLFLLLIKKTAHGRRDVHGTFVLSLSLSLSLSLTFMQATRAGQRGDAPAACIVPHRRATCCCAVSIEVSRSDERSLEYRTTGCVSSYFTYRYSNSWPPHTPAFVTPQNPNALGFINMIFGYKNLSCKIKKKKTKHGDVAT